MHDGDRAVVEVTLITGRRIAQATILDEVSDLGTARFVADQVEPRDTLQARYEVLCKPRGIYIVGPATVNVRDPLGLAVPVGRDPIDVLHPVFVIRLVRDLRTVRTPLGLGDLEPVTLGELEDFAFPEGVTLTKGQPLFPRRD